MKSLNGIALGIVFGALFFSGCTGVDHYFKREHALMPLKEQYWNGELTWNEYRDKKQALIDDLERTDYKTPEEHNKAVREAIDAHMANKNAEAKVKAEDDEEILVEDEEMIEDTEEIPATEAEVDAAAYAETETEAPTNAMEEAQAEVDYGMLSRSIKTNNPARDTGITLRSASEPDPVAETPPAPEPTVPAASGEEMITDSDQIKWKKEHDGTVIYEDPAEDELPEPEIK